MKRINNDKQLKADIRAGKKWITILINSIKRELSKEIPDTGYVIEKADNLRRISIRVSEDKRKLAGFGAF